MKILVSGGSGFIGTRFCEIFPGRVHKLRRVKSLDEIVTRMKEVNPDVVVHLAGKFVKNHTPEDVDELIDSNIRFGARLLEAMNICGVRRIVTAGTYWQHYGGEHYCPVNLYAATKQAFEDILDYYCDAKGFSSTVLLLHDTYGPNDLRGKLFTALQDMNTITIPVEDKYIDFVYVDDVCHAISLACEETRGRSGKRRFVVSTNEATTLPEAIDAWCSTTGNCIEIIRRGQIHREMTHPIGGEWVPNWTPKYTLRDGLKKIYE